MSNNVFCLLSLGNFPHQNKHILEARNAQQKENPTTKGVNAGLRLHRAAAVQLQQNSRLCGRRGRPETEISACGERPMNKTTVARIRKAYQSRRQHQCERPCLARETESGRQMSQPRTPVSQGETMMRLKSELFPRGSQS